MPTNAADIHGTVYRGGTATLLARIAAADGARPRRSDLAAIRYNVWMLDDGDADVRTPVAGHQDAVLAVAAVFFDTLQLDAAWTADAVGYNFRHTIDVRQAAAFAVAGRRHLVEYRLAPQAGQVMVVRFRLAVI